MTLILLRLIQISRFKLHKSKITYYFLILLAILISTSASSQVTADFTTVDSTTACGSIIVEFQDKKSCSNILSAWNI